jgi:hypothetical protein
LIKDKVDEFIQQYTFALGAVLIIGVLLAIGLMAGVQTYPYEAEQTAQTVDDIDSLYYSIFNDLSEKGEVGKQILYMCYMWGSLLIGEIALILINIVSILTGLCSLIGNKLPRKARTASVIAILIITIAGTFGASYCEISTGYVLGLYFISFNIIFWVCKYFYYIIKHK